MVVKTNIVRIVAIVIISFFSVGTVTLPHSAFAQAKKDICTQQDYETAKKQYDAMEMAFHNFEAIEKTANKRLSQLQRALSGIEAILVQIKKDLSELEFQLETVSNELRVVNNRYNILKQNPSKTDAELVEFNQLVGKRFALMGEKVALNKRKEDIKKTISGIEPNISNVKSNIAQEQNKINAAKDVYETKKKEAARALGLPENATFFQINQAMQDAKNWATGDCDGDGVQNGPSTDAQGNTIPGDYYPRDAGRSVVGQTGGIVPCGATDGGEEGACTLCHLIVGIHSIITQLTKWIFIFAMVIIVISGIMYVVSAGNESLTSLAKAGLKNALIGAVVILVAWVSITFALSAFAIKDDALTDGTSGLRRVGGTWTFTCSAEAPTPINNNGTNSQNGGGGNTSGGGTNSQNGGGGSTNYGNGSGNGRIRYVL